MLAKKILVVGGGVTGAALCRFLNPTVNVKDRQISFVVWEAHSVAGGRMLVDRPVYAATCSRCDMGAQYISRGITYADDNSDVYEYLTQGGTLEILERNEVIHGMKPEHTAGRHYVAPGGTDSIVASLCSDAHLVCNRELAHIQRSRAENGKLTAVSTCGVMEDFDIVVFTTTATAVRKIMLTSSQIEVPVALGQEVLAALSRVDYSSRFALAAHYTLTAAEKAHVLASVPWRAKYVLDDGVLRYVSIENFKHEQNSSDTEAPTGTVGVSILAHTSVPYGLKHIDLVRALSPGRIVAGTMTEELQRHQSKVIAEILQCLTKSTVLPVLADYRPSEVRLLGWEESQVSRSYYAGDAALGESANSRGALVAGGSALQPPALAFRVDLLTGACSETVAAGAGVEGNRAPLLVLAGDYFTESNFDGCLRSARYAAQIVARTL